MKRTLLTTVLLIISALCIAFGLSACTFEEDEIVYSTIDMEEGILYLTDFSVKYADSSEFINEDSYESLLSEEIDGGVQSYYLVMEFDMQQASNLSQKEYLTIEFTVLDADVVDTIINLANTSDTSTKTANGQTTVTATFSLPDKATIIKNVMFVLELKPKTIGGTDIIYTLSTDNMQITGYTEDDVTYKYSESAISIGTSSLDYTLNEDGQSYSVTGIGTKCGATYIKDTYNGYAVTAIADSAFKNSDLKYITIPDSITTIGASAFYGCSSLESIEMPDSVTSIGNSAFYGCTALTNIAIPKNVISIGKYAFSGCTADISWKSKSTITEIASYAFADYSGTSITIPDSVTTIGEKAFYGCSSLESLTLPFVGDSVKTSSDTYQYPLGYVFGTTEYNNSSAITQYYYGSSTSSTINTTYYIPSSLTTITITGGNILRGALYNCTSLTSITIDDGVTSIGGYAFNGCTALTSITIGNSVSSIGDSAFSGCTSLTSVTV